MASFANDLALKKFTLKNKNREWVKDDGVKFLYVLAYKTQKRNHQNILFQISRERREANNKTNQARQISKHYTSRSKSESLRAREAKR